MNLPEIFPNPPSARIHLMKLIFTLALIWGALFLGGCADQSLTTDEEYANSRGPAPHGPDPSAYLPQNPSSNNSSGRY